MPHFGKVTRQRLATCDQRLQDVMNAAIRDCPQDFGIACGHREEQPQHEAFLSGASKVDWPFGKHNPLPSRAVDVYLWPSPPVGSKEELLGFGFVGGWVMATAHRLGIALRWGGSWGWDAPHFELIEE